ncbi:Short-chain dehydrogenase [Pedobacter steynii]|uniref:Short-chain dehydrogenase n=1 Tax=Pedobacter steynii TaxID=430522 RepID=A0A1H0KNL3_9SPHI|nr:SDR family NAD(P)-dependent oxidoreductase [Pedobacter steynii]SDO57455.1 Short-chain dehydrogenase [Pedobacter steynii]
MEKKKILERLLFPSVKVNQQDLNRAIKGKTVLITGASYGIGECVAYGLAREGVTLILVARTDEKLHELKKDLEARGAIVHTFSADLRNEEALNALFVYMRQYSLEKVDILISNAGKSIHRFVYDSLDRFHDFKRTMALNYEAPVQMMLKLIPALEQQQGQIINISAINVLLAPAPGWAAYQASKTAFDQWFRCVSPELKARGIACSSLYFPLVRTRMMAPTLAYREMPAMQPEQAAEIIFRTIIKRSRIYSPWWVFPAQVFSVLFRRPWEFFISANLKKKIHAKGH